MGIKRWLSCLGMLMAMGLLGGCSTPPASPEAKAVAEQATGCIDVAGTWHTNYMVTFSSCGESGWDFNWGFQLEQRGCDLVAKGEHMVAEVKGNTILLPERSTPWELDALSTFRLNSHRLLVNGNKASGEAGWSITVNHSGARVCYGKAWAEGEKEQCLHAHLCGEKPEK